MIDMETLASTSAACHLELAAGILSVFSADTEGIESGMNSLRGEAKGFFVLLLLGSRVSVLFSLLT